MKIAVASESKMVSSHFGHCEGFTIFDVEDKKIINSSFLQNPGHQVGLLPKLLTEEKVKVVIAGGMGGMAQQMFMEKGIKVIVGINGSIENAVQQFIDNKLISSGSVCNNHEHSDTCH